MGSVNKPNMSNSSTLMSVEGQINRKNGIFSQIFICNRSFYPV